MRRELSKTGNLAFSTPTTMNPAQIARVQAEQDDLSSIPSGGAAHWRKFLRGSVPYRLAPVCAVLNRPRPQGKVIDHSVAKIQQYCGRSTTVSGEPTFSNRRRFC